jgi:acetyl esterase
MDAGTVSSGAHSMEAATQATGQPLGRLQGVKLMSSVDVRDFARNGEAPADASAAGRLDADMAHVLGVLADMGASPIELCTSPEARALPTLDMALRRILRDRVDDMDVGMEMRLIPGPTADIRVRIYVPHGEIESGRPLILYFHDGAFVLGDVDQYDATPRFLAARTNAVVVSAHYRQAPEHRFPAAHEDAWAAWNWITAHGAELGGDTQRIAIVGEGSGGNLAVNVALRGRGTDLPRPRHLGLVTPMAAMIYDLPSHRENRAMQPWSTAAFEWAGRKLFRKKDEAHDARMNIAGRLDLEGLPPATVILAAADPLRSEGEALADAMRRAGVWVDETVYDGVAHGFFGLYRVVNKALFAQGQLSRNLIAALGDQST